VAREKSRCWIRQISTVKKWMIREMPRASLRKRSLPLYLPIGAYLFFMA
jgi:hypothetical protein